MQGATYLQDSRNDDIPLVQAIKRWITEELHKPIEAVIEFEYDAPPVYIGADEKTGYKMFVPGKIITVSVRFADGTVAFRNIDCL